MNKINKTSSDSDQLVKNHSEAQLFRVLEESGLKGVLQAEGSELAKEFIGGLIDCNDDCVHEFAKQKHQHVALISLAKKAEVKGLNECPSDSDLWDFSTQSDKMENLLKIAAHCGNCSNCNELMTDEKLLELRLEAERVKTLSTLRKLGLRDLNE